MHPFFLLKNACFRYKQTDWKSNAAKRFTLYLTMQLVF